MKQLTCATPTGGLLRRFPVDEDDDDVSDDSNDSDGFDADALKQEKDDFLAHMDVIDRLEARVQCVEDEVLVLKTQAASSERVKDPRV